jgi:hypothetical protein
MSADVRGKVVEEVNYSVLVGIVRHKNFTLNAMMKFIMACIKDVHLQNEIVGLQVNETNLIDAYLEMATTDEVSYDMQNYLKLLKQLLFKLNAVNLENLLRKLCVHERFNLVIHQLILLDKTVFDHLMKTLNHSFLANLINAVDFKNETKAERVIFFLKVVNNFGEHLVKQFLMSKGSVLDKLFISSAVLADADYENIIHYIEADLFQPHKRFGDNLAIVAGVHGVGFFTWANALLTQQKVDLKIICDALVLFYDSSAWGTQKPSQNMLAKLDQFHPVIRFMMLLRGLITPVQFDKDNAESLTTVTIPIAMILAQVDSRALLSPPIFKWLLQTKNDHLIKTVLVEPISHFKKVIDLLEDDKVSLLLYCQNDYALTVLGNEIPEVLLQNWELIYPVNAAIRHRFNQLLQLTIQVFHQLVGAAEGQSGLNLASFLRSLKQLVTTLSSPVVVEVNDYERLKKLILTIIGWSSEADEIDEIKLSYAELLHLEIEFNVASGESVTSDKNKALGEEIKALINGLSEQTPHSSARFNACSAEFCLKTAANLGEFSCGLFYLSKAVTSGHEKSIRLFASELRKMGGELNVSQLTAAVILKAMDYLRLYRSLKQMLVVAKAYSNREAVDTPALANAATLFVQRTENLRLTIAGFAEDRSAVDSCLADPTMEVLVDLELFNQAYLLYTVSGQALSNNAVVINPVPPPIGFWQPAILPQLPAAACVADPGFRPQ